MKAFGWFAMIGIAAAVVTTAILALKLLFGKMGALFDGLDSQTGSVVGVIAAVLLLCAMTLAAAIRSAGRRMGDASRLNERTRIYQALVEWITRGDEPSDEADNPLALSLFLVGGAPVIKEYLALTQMVSAGNAPREEVRKQINRLMLAMRRDLGESTFGLDQEDWAGWLRNPVADKQSGRLNGASPIHRSEFVSPAVRLSNRA